MLSVFGVYSLSECISCCLMLVERQADVDQQITHRIGSSASKGGEEEGNNVVGSQT
jgi:hypothetical protein